LQLASLHAAGDYITSLPKAEQDIEEWQTAIGRLISAAEGRDFLMHTRIGMLRALNRHLQREFNSAHKDMHWARRKSKRDMSTKKSLVSLLQSGLSLRGIFEEVFR
jgi:hypothetical protein